MLSFGDRGSADRNSGGDPAGVVDVALRESFVFVRHRGGWGLEEKATLCERLRECPRSAVDGFVRFGVAPVDFVCSCGNLAGSETFLGSGGFEAEAVGDFFRGRRGEERGVGDFDLGDCAPRVGKVIGGGDVLCREVGGDRAGRRTLFGSVLGSRGR